MTETKNFRHGHRERVRARFLREGLTAFADYEILELLLFYAIPRRDTKEQAHALDDAFGSLYAVLTAPEEALCRVSGIGARTAAFLRALYPFLQYVAKEEPHADACTSDLELARRIYPHLTRGKEDTALLVFLNNRDEVITTLSLGVGKSMHLIRLEEILSVAYSYGTSAVLFADYKAEGIPFPEPDVLDGVHSLHEELLHAGVHMRDYLLFTDTQYNSLFSMSGEKRFYSPSPFFLAPEPKREVCPAQSVALLKEALTLVTSEDKAHALANSLLAKYGSLSTLLSLPYATLCKENGSEAELLYLKILSELYSSAGLSRARSEFRTYRTADDIGRMFSDILGMNTEETVALAMFDGDMRLTDVVPCARGSVNTASFALRTLVETAVAHKAAFVAVAHNHPSGVPVPSTMDIALTTDLYRAFRAAKIAFIDHFVVTSAEWTPITQQRLEGYTDMPESFFAK